MQIQILSHVPISGPPGYTGHPAPQAGYPIPPAGYPAPQASYPGVGPVGFPGQHQPVSHQSGAPAGIPWMPAPPPPANCPPGLEYLTQVFQIHERLIKNKTVLNVT